MKKLPFISIFSFLIVTFFFSGCATSKQIIGRPIDETKVNQIKDGVTNLNDIISMFGAPQTESSIGNKTLYIYKYCIVEGSGFSTGYIASTSTKQSCDELTVTFDSDAVVEAHSYQKDPNR
ncbi:MAG: hypothetical protein C0425_11795 [Chlorobiaceae bacterium]|nr:hypothetical protein [Chlorobiaceae bacterium]MBA4310996.1 hypothetical protein [Chlorobiaceae bacterium]